MEPLQDLEVTSSADIEEQRRAYWCDVVTQLDAEERALREQIDHAEERNRIRTELILLEIQDKRQLLHYETAYADNLSRLSAALAADTGRGLRSIELTSKEMKTLVAELKRSRELLRSYSERRTAPADAAAAAARISWDLAADTQHLSSLYEESRRLLEESKRMLLRARSEDS